MKNCIRKCLKMSPCGMKRTKQFHCVSLKAHFQSFNCSPHPESYKDDKHCDTKHISIEVPTDYHSIYC